MCASQEVQHCVSHAQPQIFTGAHKRLCRCTYRCKFTIDILDKKGAELRKDLEECWL